MRMMSAAFVLLVGCAAGAGCSRATRAPVAQPDCTGDSQCAARGGGVCEQGICQQCRADGDCPGPGARCVSNRCESAPAAAAPVDDGPVAVQPAEGSGCFENVYFQFDDATLSDASRASLQQTADCIRREAGQRYVLIGHADPRGASEYNLALGHRRAQAVFLYLVGLGVPRDRIAASSLGSERASGSDESSWARDRRVEYNRPGGR